MQHVKNIFASYADASSQNGSLQPLHSRRSIRNALPTAKIMCSMKIVYNVYDVLLYLKYHFAQCCIYVQKCNISVYLFSTVHLCAQEAMQQVSVLVVVSPCPSRRSQSQIPLLRHYRGSLHFQRPTHKMHLRARCSYQHHRRIRPIK